MSIRPHPDVMVQRPGLLLLANGAVRFRKGCLPLTVPRKSHSARYDEDEDEELEEPREQSSTPVESFLEPAQELFLHM